MKSKVNSKNCLIVALVAVVILIIGVLMISGANTLWDEHLARVAAGSDEELPFWTGQRIFGAILTVLGAFTASGSSLLGDKLLRIEDKENPNTEVE